jgi:hydrogenase/urease accessory protein HupE
MRSSLRAALVGLAVALFALCAGAHAAGVSRGEYRVEGAEVDALLVFSRAELATTLPGPEGLEVIVAATRVAADGAPCASRLDTSRVTQADAVELRARFTCDHAPQRVSIDAAFLDRFSADHRHLGVLSAHGHDATFALSLAQPRFESDVRAPAGASAFPRMVRTGVVHILTGYDHLAFLLGLLLLGGTVRALVGTVTAFTAAHSITLGLAALRVVSLPPSFVEPAIALSIAYVGLENLWARDAGKRWRLTFAFGLLHGFGFAGALTELDLPRAQLPAALLGFNLGVEAGQLAVLAVVLPLVLVARRSEAFRRRGVQAMSLALAAAGVFWFAERAFA